MDDAQACYEAHASEWTHRLKWDELSEETKHFWRDVALLEKGRKPEA